MIPAHDVSVESGTKQNSDYEYSLGRARTSSASGEMLLWFHELAIANGLELA